MNFNDHLAERENKFTEPRSVWKMFLLLARRKSVNAKMAEKWTQLNAAN